MVAGSADHRGQSGEKVEAGGSASQIQKGFKTCGRRKLHIGVDPKCDQSREIHEQLPRAVGEGCVEGSSRRRRDRQRTGQHLLCPSSGIGKATVASLCGVLSLMFYLREY